MFKITIEETKVETVVIGKQWSIVREEDGKIERDYTPEVETRQTVKRTVFEQTVETLDIRALVSVINDI